MTTPTKAEVSFLVTSEPSEAMKKAIESATGFSITDQQLRFMASSGCVFRTTAQNVAFQVQLMG